MDERDAWRQLRTDELVTIIVALPAQVTQVEAQRKRPAKRPRNSSLPSSQSRKAQWRKGEQAKRSPKEGHSGTSRTTAGSAVVGELRGEQCAAGGAALGAVGQQRGGSSPVVDLPPVRPVGIEGHRDGACGPGGGQEPTAASPAGLEAERVLGPRLEAGGPYLHLAHPLSEVRVQDSLQDLFELAISLGARVNAGRRASAPLREAAQTIREQV